MVPFVVVVGTKVVRMGWPWSSLVEGGRYEPSPPSTKELHGLAHTFNHCYHCTRIVLWSSYLSIELEKWNPSPANRTL